MHDSPALLHGTLDLPARFVAAGAYAAAQGYDFPAHQHAIWEIVCYRSGHVQSPQGDTVYDCGPGVVLLTPPGMTHAEHAWTAYSNFWVQIDAAPNMPWPMRCHDDADHSFERVCGALAREHGRHSRNRAAMIELLLRQLLILIERDQEQHQLSQAERLVRAAEHFFAQHYASTVAMHEVAHALGVAPSTLRARFAQVRGVSPLAALQAVRLHHALRIIRNTTLTLEAVAALCGYDSASHLSRYVKRATGESPGMLRHRRE